ncbi:MAG: hypothetical protein JW801_03560 [Bacteroidales bacterium]|nr:hypothetical protein [Bacteroidales bacterium]
MISIFGTGIIGPLYGLTVTDTEIRTAHPAVSTEPELKDHGIKKDIHPER